MVIENIRRIVLMALWCIDKVGISCMDKNMGSLTLFMGVTSVKIDENRLLKGRALECLTIHR